MNDIQRSLPWLQTSWTQLRNYISQNRLPQALLIIGNKGLGKRQLADVFAQTLLCTSPQTDAGACGKCQSCTLFNAQTHPDYIVIEPEEEGKVIGISVIRQLTSRLVLKPQFESHRVVIIDPADSLTNASANAFLKYLEEPTERTCLILITDKPATLPATITSRCQKLQLSEPDETAVKTWLKQQGILENIDLLCMLSQGAPFLAKRFADNSTVELRTECFNKWSKLSQSEESLISTAEEWQKLGKADIDLLLFWLTTWVMDIIKLKYKQEPIKIVNQDLIINLQEMADKLDLKGLYSYYDLLLLSRQRFGTQLNKQLMFEEILILWTKLNSR
jgi:DNA polymerase-3 subunit delta'